jgi:hypothetical protein
MITKLVNGRSSSARKRLGLGVFVFFMMKIIFKINVTLKSTNWKLPKD